MIKTKTEEHENGTRLFWICDEIGDICVNHNGVKSSHMTFIDQGAGVYRIKGESERVVKKGDSIEIPVGVPYEFEATGLEDGLGIVRCEYTKKNEDEIRHLKSAELRQFPTLKTSIIKDTP
jgi:mannose-6-phosphate isomerase-like protein (cupin superfamily)